MENPPDPLRTAAIVQLVVGIIDLSVGAALASFVWGMLGCFVTFPCACLGLPPIGSMCGMLGILVVPLGIAEIVAGIVGLTSPRQGAAFMQVTSVLGMLGILAGSITSPIGGAITLMQLRSPAVRDWLLTGPIDVSSS